jgi:hypothetical protein
LVAGWQLPVYIVDADASDVLSLFQTLEALPLIRPRDKKYFRAGDLFRVPGLPAKLDTLSHLARTDSSADANFYSNPRLVTHIDDSAIAALKGFYRDHLKTGQVSFFR